VASLSALVIGRSCGQKSSHSGLVVGLGFATGGIVASPFIVPPRRVWGGAPRGGSMADLGECAV
jgi:hypothetical protein